MAKYRTIGSVCKRKDGNGTHIKISEDVTLKKGEYINLESKVKQLEKLDKAQGEGKISEENAEKARERINKIPDFVMFELIRKTD